MQNIIREINTLASKINHQIILMELCGTHTEAVARHGIKKLLPENIKLLSGPGCPVCVTDQRDIDAVIALALEGIPIACYGDVLRVPGTLKNQNEKIKMKNDKLKCKNNKNCHCEETGRTPFNFIQGKTRQSQTYCASRGIALSRVLGTRNDSIINLSLDKAREMGADVTEVYSVEDAMELQKKKPNLVFFGIGFETTAPMSASAIKRGLTIYSSHKAFVPAMKALLNTPQLKVDGFINPGHVSAIIGIEPYKMLNTKYQIPNTKTLIQNSKFKIQSIPQVIAGFEADDILITIYMLLKQIAEGRADVENEYTRVVRPEGNPKARELINEVFEIGNAFWRGIGKIPNSGFEIRPKYSQFDAKVKYKDIIQNSIPSTRDKIQNSATGCICGAILRGLKEPQDCKLFNKKCTPEDPIGACMVSSEGACGIEARFK